MKYIDPYDFLDLKVGSPAEVDQAMLALAKKKLLADFEFSTDGMLAWQGAALSKSDAIALLEQLEDPVLRQDHWKIRQLPGMRILLQDHKLSGMLKAELAELLAQLSLQQLVLPFMVAAFSQVLRKALADERLQEFGMVLNLIKPFALTDDAPLWQDSLRLLNSLTGLMQEAAEKPESRQRAMTTYGSAEICAMLNRIPGRFQPWRDAYAVALAKLVVANYNAIISTVGLKRKLVPIRAACRAYQSLEISYETKQSLKMEEFTMLFLLTAPEARIGRQQMPQRMGRGPANRPTAIIVVAALMFVCYCASILVRKLLSGHF